MASATYLIGVDTGGTYTDAAVIEAKGHKVVASAKSITTKGDLSIGVSGAITAAIAALPRGLHPENIALVSVSTTLATNAVVEGHGSAVGVILIGFDQAMAERTGIAKAFPGMPMAMIAGGHDHTGAEAQPLDAVALEAAAAAMPVDAFAIASAFAVRNPAHEHAARDLVARVTGKPATLSTELTSSLDAPRRALTAVLNARLISRISMLITAVRSSMAELGIDCPLMIVKGDGTLALAERVALRPIETVLSGPAASLVGASWLCGRRDFIMSDMGGTTTDLGVLRDGRPQVAEQGAEVGGWRTMVKAIDVRTIGLGGDSEIGIGLDGKLTWVRSAWRPFRCWPRAIRKSSRCSRPIWRTPKADRCMAVRAAAFRRHRLCAGGRARAARARTPRDDRRAAAAPAQGCGVFGRAARPGGPQAQGTGADRRLHALRCGARAGSPGQLAGRGRRAWQPSCWCASAT